MTEHGITGNWRGHYSYSSMPDEGSGFEALFAESKGVVTGHILDDGGLGEASLNGSFHFPSVSFTKVYYNPAHRPISYTGTMSDDGKTITGRWEIRLSDQFQTKGTWMAHRLDKDEKKSEKQEHRAKADLEEVR